MYFTFQFGTILDHLGPFGTIWDHLGLGLYRTSRPVQKSGKFSKSRLLGNWMFSFPDTGLLTFILIEKKLKIFFEKKKLIFFVRF